MNKLIFTLGMLLILLTGSLLNAQSGWSLQTNPLGIGESAILGKIQFVSPTEGWISGGRGDLLHTTDAGANWIQVTPFPNDTVWCSSDPSVSMSWVNQTHGWKINSFGPDYGISYGVVIHRTTNGGNTWEQKVLSTTEDDFGFQIQFVDINTGWLLYFNFSTQVATFLKTTDGGDNWVPFNGAGIFYFVDANNGWSYYGSGQNGSEPPYKILCTTNGGTDWVEQFSDNAVGGYNAIYFSDFEHGWIVGDNGKVLKTTDGGANWNFVYNSGINPDERSKTVFFLDANIGWISSKTDNNVAFIQYTTDGGASWVSHGIPINNPNDGNSIYSIYFVDAQNGWLTGGTGNICHYSETSGIYDDNFRVKSFSLSQNYPNPFNPETIISYQLPEISQVSLKIYDFLGREIVTLVNEQKSAGTNRVTFDGSGLASGIYYYQLSAGSLSESKKMILLK